MSRGWGDLQRRIVLAAASEWVTWTYPGPWDRWVDLSDVERVHPLPTSPSVRRAPVRPRHPLRPDLGVTIGDVARNLNVGLGGPIGRASFHRAVHSLVDADWLDADSWRVPTGYGALRPPEGDVDAPESDYVTAMTRRPVLHFQMQLGRPCNALEGMLVGSTIDVFEELLDLQFQGWENLVNARAEGVNTYQVPEPAQWCEAVPARLWHWYDTNLARQWMPWQVAFARYASALMEPTE